MTRHSASIELMLRSEATSNCYIDDTWATTFRWLEILLNEPL